MDEATIHAERARDWSDREGEAGMAVERRPEAREALDRVFMAGEAIHSQINAMEERLHDLLGPERPGEAKPGDVRANSTTFGGRMHEAADQLAAADRRLADLLDRLRDGF